MNNKSIKELYEGLNSGEFTSVDLVKHCLKAIAEKDQSGRCLNSIAEVEPNALFIAEALDKERKAKGPRSLLHGIPFSVKDNINTKETMHTTAGSLALADLIAPKDAFVIEKLKAAGAIILAKANLSEFAYFMSRNNMPSGYSSRGGQVVHPYCPGFDPSGSSSGSAVSVAARIVPVSVGTETNGSLTSPSKSNAIACIKPTVGLISREGIIPISHHQDTAGPMGKSIEDCAIMLEVMAGKDENDVSTYTCPNNIKYSEACIDDLTNMKIGILHYAQYPYNERQLSLIHKLKEIIQNKNGQYKEITLDNVHYDGKNTLQHEFKNGINRYLASVRNHCEVKSLEDIIAFNNAHADTCLRYGQTLLEESDALSGLLIEKEYIEARVNVTQDCRNVIDSLLKANDVDCIVSLYNMGIAPTAGYPAISIPADEIDESAIDPQSFVFWGNAYSEYTLIQAAYAIESGLNLNCCPSWVHIQK